MTGRDPPALLMLGVGTAEGAPVTQEKGGFLKDAQGGILVPRLDGPVLKDFADSMAGRYTALRLDNQDLNDLGLLDGPKSLISEGQKVRLDRWADQGYWLLLPLLLLAGCAGRRGWLLCLPLLLMTVPQASYAFDFQDLWRTPDQQGERLLRRHHPAEAARHFQDPRWQGVALYQAGDYAGAAQRFAQGSSAVDHYNRGNALARSGELEGAIDAYAQALDRQPDFPAALANKALVEQVLELNKTANPSKTETKAETETETDENGNNARQGSAGDSSSSASSAPRDPDENRPPEAEQNAADQEASGAGGEADGPARAAGRPAEGQVDGEQKQALEQWLRQIPDEPGELLRRKFWYEQQQHQEKTR
jgi:Ca-activated chloride channel family protein